MRHLRLHCLACEGEGRSSIFLEPPCDVRHREQLGGWQLTRRPRRSATATSRKMPGDFTFASRSSTRASGAHLVLRGLQQGFVGLSVIGVAVVMHTKLDAAVAAQALGNDALGPKARHSISKATSSVTGWVLSYA
jgi:hypothetical protein